MKNVQIPYELFIELVRYHLLDMVDCGEEIQSGLAQKLDAMALREMFTKSKCAPTPEEREKARQEYLDRRGVCRTAFDGMFLLNGNNRSVTRSCVLQPMRKEGFCRKPTPIGWNSRFRPEAP